MRNYLDWTDEQRSAIVLKVYDQLLTGVLSGQMVTLKDCLVVAGPDHSAVSDTLWYKWMAQPWARELTLAYQAQNRQLIENDVRQDWRDIIGHLRIIAKGNLGDPHDHIKAAQVLATLFPDLSSDQRRDLSPGRAAILIERFVVGEVQINRADQLQEKITIEGTAKVVQD